MKLFNITLFGFSVYVLYVLTIAWILWRKDHKLVSVVFPLTALTEGLFIDWRWERLQNYTGASELILGALPSFIIAIGFPFVGFCLHHFLPERFRAYANEQNWFPSIYFSIFGMRLRESSIISPTKRTMAAQVCISPGSTSRTLR